MAFALESTKLSTTYLAIPRHSISCLSTQLFIILSTMKTSSFFVLVACAAAMASPISSIDQEPNLESRADRGSYTVSGLGARKQAILGAGGNTLDIAIAMLET
ncbi:hypothetical protein EYR41_009930 [Orbilia oligospora]|uniref:Uncharacterized protein n=1 Tax=Orbilia oligospora TaxID=2813651 RepID=A0A8H2HNX3_ORBOL|nr:hypothetical protein EYR41_009930 [Orbilia oligospora]